jgi:hypothetical protein
VHPAKAGRPALRPSLLFPDLTSPSVQKDASLTYLSGSAEEKERQTWIVRAREFHKKDDVFKAPANKVYGPLPPAPVERDPKAVPLKVYTYEQVGSGDDTPPANIHYVAVMDWEIRIPFQEWIVMKGYGMRIQDDRTFITPAVEFDFATTVDLRLPKAFSNIAGGIAHAVFKEVGTAASMCF